MPNDNPSVANSDDDDESEDEDYVPSEHEVSEEDNSGDDEDFVSDDKGSQVKSKKKRKKNTKNDTDSNPRLARSRTAPDEQSAQLKRSIEAEQAASKEIKEKTRADALWASFMTDVGPKAKASSSKETTETKSGSTEKSSLSNGSTKKPAATVKVTQVFDFAGETVRLDKEVPVDSIQAKSMSSTIVTSEVSDTTSAGASGAKRPGGLGAVLGFINKKQKISTLDKSKLDWDKYKTEAGITEELKHHANSKTSYLERKEFLERADQRQFEKERDARLVSASKRKL